MCGMTCDENTPCTVTPIDFNCSCEASSYTVHVDRELVAVLTPEEAAQWFPAEFEELPPPTPSV